MGKFIERDAKVMIRELRIANKANEAIKLEKKIRKAHAVLKSVEIFNAIEIDAPTPQVKEAIDKLEIRPVLTVIK